MKKGTASLWATALALIFFLAIAAVVNRPYAYMAYQHASYTLGLNRNNIATNNYVNFIKFQNNQASTDGQFLSQKFTYKLHNLPTTAILGSTTSSQDKWIEVDLSDQRLNMKEGDNTVGSFLVSSGKWAPTPTGEWRIWTKLRTTRMEGGSKALNTYYNLPNVPYTMYYYQGYGIHGAYWHNNFGHPMSHGCINMRPEEAGIVFNWAEVGTRVVVHS